MDRDPGNSQAPKPSTQGAGPRTGAAPSFARGLSPELTLEVASMLRQLGLRSLRASVVDTATMVFRADWSITDTGDVRDGGAGRPLDSVFPGASSTIEQLGGAVGDTPVSHRLSPRHWVFAWRLDAAHAAVAEAQFHQRCDEVDESQIAMIRLICNASIRGAAEATAATSASRSMTWPQVDRRGRPVPPRSSWLLPLAMLIVALIVGWLAWVALPAGRDTAVSRQGEIQRLGAMADASLTHSVSVAIATDDYGEVQTVLSTFMSLGYFKRAVVVNARDRIVAIAGPSDSWRIGDELPARAKTSGRSLPLALGSQAYGRLLLLEEPVPTLGDGLPHGTQLAAVLAFALSLGATGLAMVRRRSA